MHDDARGTRAVASVRTVATRVEGAFHQRPGAEEDCHDIMLLAVAIMALMTIVATNGYD